MKIEPCNLRRGNNLKPPMKIGRLFGTISATGLSERPRKQAFGRALLIVDAAPELIWPRLVHVGHQRGGLHSDD